MTGQKVFSFSADGLPDGLKLDSQTGRITGTIQSKGEFVVTLHAKNGKGADEKKLLAILGLAPDSRNRKSVQRYIKLAAPPVAGVVS